MWSDWGKRLKRHMKDAAVTQEKIAEGMGISQGAVAHWLSGRRDINLKDFFALCGHAGADPSRMLFGETPKDIIADLNKFLADHPGLREAIAQPSVPPIVAAAALPAAPKNKPMRRKAVAGKRRKKGVQK